MFVNKIDNTKCKSIRGLNQSLRKYNLSVLEYYIQYEGFKIPRCEFCGENAKHAKGLNFHRTCCSTLCKKQLSKSIVLSNEAKLKISTARKKYLQNNPKNHVWKRSDKFKSIPCENVKEILRKNNIYFKEEVSVVPSRYFSCDILIPSKNLILEVNGNQHYNKDGSLRKYYQERHNLIKQQGFNIIEIHYSKAFDKQLILSLLDKYANESINLPFKIKVKKESKYKNHKHYTETVKLQYDLSQQKYIKLVQNSGIDFSKFGWVKEVSKLINQKPQKVKKWMIRFLPSFYDEKCFKRLN